MNTGDQINKEQLRKKPRGILWRILFIIAALLMLAVLELGKHTIPGWVLTIILLAGFPYLRQKNFSQKGKLFRLGAWCALFMLFAGILRISWPPIKAVPAVSGKTGGITDVVHIAQGDLTGIVTADGQVEVYAGIPYAKPPIGNLRWREPQPADAWQGVLAADHFAPMSMQTTNLPIYDSLVQVIGYHDYQISLHDHYRPPVSEDSLYLNIWKPAGKESGLPVLVYIHGGSLQTGQPWYQDYSGEGLARDGVIVVNMGYRLGVFGFFADKALAEESETGTTGNYGLLDQILALQWVQDNIAAFGGNPDNVTLAGESAGSACVSALCTSPLAKDLFRRAVGESSTVTSPEPAHSFRLMEDALKAGEETKQRLHAETTDDLRALPAEKLVGELDTHHHITIDGTVLPQTPYEAYAHGIHNEEALMHGFNREESAPFILFSQASLNNYESKIRASFAEPYASRVLDLYPASTDAEARGNWADIYTAVIFSYGHYCWERQAAENGIPSYLYHFTKENGRLGSWHSGEEVYLYGNIPAASLLYDASDRALSDSMKQYFLNFIRTGDPNGEDLPLWPADTGGETVLEWGNEIALQEAPYRALYDILDDMYNYTENRQIRD